MNGIRNKKKNNPRPFTPLHQQVGPPGLLAHRGPVSSRQCYATWHARRRPQCGVVASWNVEQVRRTKVFTAPPHPPHPAAVELQSTLQISRSGND